MKPGDRIVIVDPDGMRFGIFSDYDDPEGRARVVLRWHTWEEFKKVPRERCVRIGPPQHQFDELKARAIMSPWWIVRTICWALVWFRSKIVEL